MSILLFIYKAFDLGNIYVYLLLTHIFDRSYINIIRYCRTYFYFLNSIFNQFFFFNCFFFIYEVIFTFILHVFIIQVCLDWILYYQLVIDIHSLIWRVNRPQMLLIFNENTFPKKQISRLLSWCSVCSLAFSFYITCIIISHFIWHFIIILLHVFQM